MLNKLKSKIQTMLWFVKNPKYIPQIFQVLKRDPSSENTREESTEWCKAKAVSRSEALKQLGIKESTNDIKADFPQIFQEAEKRAEASPFKMGGEGDLSMIFNICKGFKVQRAIESGVAYGWSSLSILLAIKDQKNGLLISNDMPYIKMNNEDYVGTVVPNELKNKWILQREPDVNGIPKAIKRIGKELDLFHYDSDKSYSGRMWASPIIWNALKEGGIFISDDINDNLAFKHFAEKVNRTPVIIEHLGKYVGVLQK